MFGIKLRLGYRLGVVQGLSLQIDQVLSDPGLANNESKQREEDIVKPK